MFATSACKTYHVNSTSTRRKTVAKTPRHMIDHVLFLQMYSNLYYVYGKTQSEATHWQTGATWEDKSHSASTRRTDLPTTVAETLRHMMYISLVFIFMGKHNLKRHIDKQEQCEKQDHTPHQRGGQTVPLQLHRHSDIWCTFICVYFHGETQSEATHWQTGATWEDKSHSASTRRTDLPTTVA